MSEEKKSYGQILKSSSLVGGAQVINLLIGMVRVKFVAVLLGPTGVGLQGVLMSIRGMASILSGLGINSSGVRNVAEAVSADDETRIARTVISLRRMCWVTGVIGAVGLALLAKPISKLSFGSDIYAIHIAFLGLAVLMGSISAGQMALIQGMRRIADLAKLNVISAVVGSFLAVGYFWFLGLEGIVPSLVSLAAVSLLASYFYARRIPLTPVEMTWLESFREAKSLVSLGVVFMWSALLGAVVMYATRTLITQEIDLAAVGVYSAAFALSGMFLNFVLAAMGADYYPALTGVAHDHGKMREMVNQQTEIGLLLAAPGLLATLVLAPWIIHLFYTSAFIQSADLLQWFVMGCLGRVISWPMGFILLAKGAGKMFAFSETLFNLLHLALIWGGLKWIGIEGVAMAFCGMYIMYSLFMLVISRHLIDFRWSAGVWRLLMVLLPLAIGTMVLSRELPLIPGTIIGCLMTLFIGIFCLRGLCLRLGPDHKIVALTRKIPLSKYIL